MALKAYRGRQFEYTHENKAFNRLYDAIKQHCLFTGQDWHLLANFYVGSRELDALLIKPNAIIIIDFKEYSGTLEFSESGPWIMEDESGRSVEVKGGASVNPLRQLTINKHAMIEFLSRNMANLNTTCNWRHTAALVAFQGTVEFDAKQLPGGIKPWFHISDEDQLIRDIDAIVCKQISLPPEGIERIIKQLGIEPYVPPGGPEVRPLGESSENAPPTAILTQQQSALLQQFRRWLEEGAGMFRVGGMASTGKRFLFPHLIDEIKAANCEVLLLTPSVRLSGTYYHSQVQPSSIYTWLYSREPDHFEVKNDRKIGIHRIKEGLLASGQIPVLVDAHLMSDEEFEVTDRRYGSGRLIQDFLSVIETAKAPFVAIGDPYQTPRGSLQRSLMTNSLLEQQQLYVTGELLTEQILQDPEDALSQFQSHLVSRLINTQFNCLPRVAGKRLQIYDVHSKTSWAPDVSNVCPESTLVCATHEQNSKINAAVKTRILGHPSPVRLGISDRIDFYNRTPILTNDGEGEERYNLRWISAGEIGFVDDVHEGIETHSVQLRGRSDPIHLRFQLARCRLPGVGEVRFRYLVDFYEAGRPELTTDQVLALQVLARQLAKPLLAELKDSLPDKKDPAYKEARANYDRQEYLTLQAQGYASAALIRPAHAMTLHRAQGRNWPCVWVNASRSASSDKPDNADYFRWLYTASTIAKEQLVVRQMPALTPLMYATVSRGHDLRIGPFPIRAGLFYDTARQPTEQESSIVPPTGFNDVALLPLLLALNERLDRSPWRIKEWKEYSFQVVIRLTEGEQQGQVAVRLHYDKKLAITNKVFTQGTHTDQATIDKLICEPFHAQSSALQDALEAVVEKLATHGFSLAEASESAYLLHLVLVHGEDAMGVQVNADKRGMVSSIRINRASSEQAISRFTSAMEARP
ncbi:ATP-binding domain-containing protein [Halomonas halodenitrificans]|uniref:ATP-binding domain-containing protein n=1 Tax=Halomonas halodenitrificans TaxID=28252 RepID=UPI000486180C|nr:ATP-binding domain-containing protein [Halomonas halodenitrificans]